MKLMLRLRNRKYVAFFPVGCEIAAKNFRAKYPEMKGARLQEIFVAYPSKITPRFIYGRYDERLS